ncbi:MAG TPA: GAF domain-containing protein [Terriglobales bacterium]|nr:GAF domain-containing protein [Terriglobales bacterium]
MSSRISADQIHFLSLQTAIFCVQCELISANTTPYCLACGSKSVLGLSRMFGGSLRGQSTARVIEDVELNQLVRDLLYTVPSSELEREYAPAANHWPERHHLRTHSEAVAGASAQVSAPQINLEPAIALITERAQVLTGASGAAIALRKGEEVICRARAGRTAPDLGVRLQTESGVSARCLRSGEVVLCNNAEDDPHADRLSCQRLGVRSILAAPLREYTRTLGIFEVLSATPNAFSAQDIATMQLLSSMMVAAIARVSRIGSPPPRACGTLTN